MTHRLVLTALVLAILLVAAVSLPYVWQFGTHPIASRDAWGQFGSYFAGLLSPLFSLLAFLALLYSILLQREEASRSKERFEAQYEITKKELADYGSERVTSELLSVVRDVGGRLDDLLKKTVSPPNSHPLITIALMVSEGNRLRQHDGESKSYKQFISLAKEQGSVVEALIREMTTLIEEMRDILAQFSEYRGTAQAPLIVYYANKVYGLLVPLEDAGTLPPDTRTFFASVSDKHH